jgi:hypothetical protein
VQVGGALFDGSFQQIVDVHWDLGFGDLVISRCGEFNREITNSQDH